MDGKNEIWNLPPNSPDIISRLFSSAHSQRLLVLKQQAAITLVRSNLFPIGPREFVFGPRPVAFERHYITDLVYCTVRCLTMSPPDSSLDSSHLSLTVRLAERFCCKEPRATSASFRSKSAILTECRAWFRPYCSIHMAISCLVILHLADTNPDMNPFKLLSQSNPVVRPSYNGVPHSTGIPTFSLQRTLAGSPAHIQTRWWGFTSIFPIIQTK